MRVCYTIITSFILITFVYIYLYKNQYKQLYHNSMTKLFAELDIKKQKMEEQDSKEKKRQREEEEAIEVKAKKEKEWKTEWEVCHISILNEYY